MSKWAVGLIAVLASAVAIPTFAGAAGQRGECKLDLRTRNARTKTFSGQPPASGRDESAGTVDGTICGKAFHGALRQRNSYPDPPGFNTKVVTFGPSGSFRSKGSGTGQVNGDGSISLHGEMEIVGGAGKYKDANGTIKFTGRVPFKSPVALFHFTGTIKY
jgi:hypothetical protein